MDRIPQIVPISDLRIRHGEVLSKLDKGPVVLAQRSRPAAVLVSVEDWDKTIQRLSELEERELIRLRLRASHDSPDVSFEDFMGDLKEESAAHA